MLGDELDAFVCSRSILVVLYILLRVKIARNMLEFLAKSRRRQKFPENMSICLSNSDEKSFHSLTIH